MAKTYIHYGAYKFDINKFKPVSGEDRVLNKPIGGFWASPIDTDWGWKNWCESERYNLIRLNKSFKFTLDKKAKVYHIRPDDSILELPFADECKDKVFNSDCRLYIGDWWYDWNKIATIYDAVELHISDDYATMHDMFYCWDCDSIVIFNPNIIIEKKV